MLPLLPAQPGPLISEFVSTSGARLIPLPFKPGLTKMGMPAGS